MSPNHNLPPGVTRREIDERYADPPERRCRRCGEWFIPDDAEGYCGRCRAEEDESEHKPNEEKP